MPIGLDVPDCHDVVLEWMIAAVALCGALAGFTALYLALRYALQGDGGPHTRRDRVLWRWRRARSRDRAWNAAAELPRARVYRCKESAARRARSRLAR